MLRNDLYRESIDAAGAGRQCDGKRPDLVRIEGIAGTARQSDVQRLAARSKALGSPCLVLSDPADVSADPQEMPAGARPMTPDLEHLPPAVRVPVELRRYDDRSLDFNVIVPADGWLLVTDRWAPSWQVRINDVPQRVWIGNLVFRAVAVKQGENRVRFHYEPSLYPWLLAVSWLSRWRPDWSTKR